MSLAFFFFSSSSRCKPQHCRTKDSQINRVRGGGLVAEEREKNASFVRILNALLTKFPYLIATRVQIGTEAESAAVFIHLLNLFLLSNFFFPLFWVFIRIWWWFWWPFRYAESKRFIFSPFIRTMWRQTTTKNYGEVWCGGGHISQIYGRFYELSNISGSDKRRKLILPLRKPAIVPMQMAEWRVLSLYEHKLRQLAHHFLLERFAICFNFSPCVSNKEENRNTTRLALWNSRENRLDRLKRNSIFLVQRIRASSRWRTNENCVVFLCSTRHIRKLDEKSSSIISSKPQIMQIITSVPLLHKWSDPSHTWHWTRDAWNKQNAPRSKWW